MNEICEHLRATLDPDSATRSRGENYLNTRQSEPGFLLQIGEIILQTRGDPATQHAAGVYFKNVVKKFCELVANGVISDDGSVYSFDEDTIKALNIPTERSSK